MKILSKSWNSLDFDCSNQPQTLAGIMQSPGMLQGYAFPSNNIQNNGDNSSNVFMPNSDLNANFSRGKNITEQVVLLLLYYLLHSIINIAYKLLKIT
jgi:hypothetical protein